jgi:hypothetical protein
MQALVLVETESRRIDRRRGGDDPRDRDARVEVEALVGPPCSSSSS